MLLLLFELVLAVCVAARPNNLEANGSEDLDIIGDSVSSQTLKFHTYLPSLICSSLSAFMTTIAKLISSVVLEMTPQKEFAQSVSSAKICTTEIEV